MPHSDRFRTLQLFSVALLAALVAAAEPISPQTPPGFGSRPTEELIPLADVRERQHAFDATTADGIVLLREESYYLAPDGTSRHLVHRILQPRTAAGVTRMATLTVPFNRDGQRLYLVQADTVEPSGNRTPLPANDLEVRAAPAAAGLPLYASAAELVLHVRNLSPGMIVEYVAVVDETVPPLPGEFTARFAFATDWPMVLGRLRIDVPDSTAHQLKVTPVGDGVPEESRTAADGRVRAEWTKTLSPPLVAGEGIRPALQVGPAVWLTTVGSWDTIASWYLRESEGRAELDATLQKQVAEWTEGLDDAGRIIDRLLRAVAGEVKTVPVALGRAGFLPTPCSATWERRQGDGKDKALLLQGLLAARGITAYPTLVNTAHVGRIIRQSPDLGQFDHVLVAVLTKNGFAFCDPSSAYVEGGQLPPSVMGREAVVLTPKGAQFSVLPAENRGSISYLFDLEVSRRGSITGWLTLRLTDYHAAVAKRRFAGLDKEGLSREMQDYVKRFFPDADLVDLARFDAVQEDANSYQIRGYLSQPPKGRAAERALELAFPAATVLPELDETPTRQAPYVQEPHTVTVQVGYRLPLGWQTLDNPAPFTMTTFPVTVDARWRVAKQQCVAVLTVNYNHALVPADQYPFLYNAVNALRDWLGHPMAVGEVPQVASTEAAIASGKLPDLPVMPTARRQLDLVNRMFPADGPKELRRQALERVLQWFPNDASVVFETRVHLLLLGDDADKIVKALRSLLEGAKGGGVDRESYAWGVFMLAEQLKERKQLDQAAFGFLGLARDTTLSANRRGWAYLEAARCRLQAAPAQSIAILRQAFLLDSEALPEQVVLLADLLLATRQHSELAMVLAATCGDGAAHAKLVLAKVLERVNVYIRNGKSELYGPMLGLLASYIEDDPAFAEFRGKLQPSEKVQEYIDDYSRIQARINEDLRAGVPDWYRAVEVDKSLTSRPDFLLDMERRRQSGDVDGYLRHAFEFLRRFPPDHIVFGEVLWRSASLYLDRHASDSLAEKVVAWCESLPADHRLGQHAGFLRGYWYSQNGRDDEALATFKGLLEQPDVPASQQLAAQRFLAQLYEKRGELDEAVKHYTAVLEQLGKTALDGEMVLRAVFIRLHQRNWDQALDLLDALGKLDKDALGKQRGAWQLQALLSLAKDRPLARRFWGLSEGWWPLWITLAQQLDGIDPKQRVTPVIADPAAFAQGLRVAIGRHDTKALAKALALLAEAARWQPDMLQQLFSILYPAVQAFPEQATDIHRLAVAIGSAWSPSDPDQRRRHRVTLGAHCFDLDQGDKALALAKAACEERKVEDALDLAAVQLLAAAALKVNKDVDLAVAKLEEALGTKLDAPQRAKTVRQLAQLYARLGRTAEEVTLLRSELANPVMAEHQELAAPLQERLQELQQPPPTTTSTSESVDAAMAALTAWLKQHRPDWYAYARPESLADPQLKDLDAVLNGKQKPFRGAEWAKLLLLLAEDGGQPAERRLQAFDGALSIVRNAEAGYARRKTLLDDAIGQEAFPVALRQKLLLDAVAGAVDSGNLGDVAGYRDTRLWRSLDSAVQQRVDGSIAFARQLSGPPEELAKQLVDLCSKALTASDMARLTAAYERLLQRNELDAANQVYLAFEKATLDEALRSAKTEWELRLVRALNAARDTAAVYSKMRERLLAEFPEDTAASAAAVRRYVRIDAVGQVDGTAGFQLLVGIVNEYRGAGGPQIWFRVFDLLRHEKQRPDLAKELYAMAVQGIRNDAVKAQFLAGLVQLFDIDQEEERQQAGQLVQPFADPKVWPQSTAAIQLFQIQVALRMGRTVDLSPSLLPKSGAQRDQLLLLALRQSLRHGDKASLTEIIDALGTQRLVHPAYVPWTIPALEMLGRQDEAAVVRKSTAETLHQTVVDSWLTLDGIGRALALADALGDAASYPQEWVDFWQQRIANKRQRSLLLIRHYSLRGQWAEAAREATTFLERYPTYYDLYWDKGRALAELNRPAEAREALTLFLRHALDNPDYSDAAALFKKLGGTMPDQP